MKEGDRRQRGIYCTREEWAWVSAQAKASGMGVGQYLVHCGLNVEVPAGGVEKPTQASALSPDEQRQLLDKVDELSKLNKAQFGKNHPAEPDLLGMVRVCFEVARSDYLDKHGSFAFDKLMAGVLGKVGGDTW